MKNNGKEIRGRSGAGPGVEIPLIGAHVSAGFPSPADDYIETRLDLNKELIFSQSSTFFARVRGDSMKDAGIGEGDLLIIDRSMPYKSGSVVLCMIGGEYTVKRLVKRNNKHYLFPENTGYAPVELKEDMDITIWGVVTYSIRKQF